MKLTLTQQVRLARLQIADAERQLDAAIDHYHRNGCQFLGRADVTAANVRLIAIGAKLDALLAAATKRTYPTRGLRRLAAVGAAQVSP